MGDAAGSKAAQGGWGSKVIALLLGPSARYLGAQKLEPLVYTISFPDPASKSFNVSIAVPTGRRESVDLMMAIWSHISCASSR